MPIPHQRLFLLMLILLLTLFCAPAYANSPLTVYLDGTEMNFQATTVKNLVFISARDLTDSLGGTLKYDPAKKSMTITHGKTSAVLNIGSSTILVNNKKVSLDAAPMLVDSVAMIPVKAVTPIWGASVDWNEQSLYMNSDGSAIVLPEVPKVFVEKKALSVDNKETTISYIRIPQDSNLKADVVIAQNTIGQTENLQNLAQRNYAKAAINGNYFQSYDSAKAMEPYGLIIKNGHLIHAESTGGTIGFTTDGQIKIDIIRSSIKASLNGTEATISLINHTPTKDSDQIVLFTNAHGNKMGFAFGTNVVVQNGEVTSIVQNDNTDIPSSTGYVLNFTGSQEKLAASLKKGDAISYQVSYVNASGNRVDWSDIHTAIGAGPILLLNGSVAINPAQEGFSDTTGFSLATARSAIGSTSNNDLILVAGVKSTLDQLATIMSQLGAVNAISLDAGSVSGSYALDQYVATPGKEISTALIFK